MSWLDTAAAAAYTALALVLAVVALHAASVSRSRRTVLLAWAFGLLAAKGVLLSVALFVDPQWSRWLAPALALDAAALLVIYLALLKRGP